MIMMMQAAMQCKQAFQPTTTTTHAHPAQPAAFTHAVASYVLDDWATLSAAAHDTASCVSNVSAADKQKRWGGASHHQSAVVATKATSVGECISSFLVSIRAQIGSSKPTPYFMHAWQPATIKLHRSSTTHPAQPAAAHHRKEPGLRKKHVKEHTRDRRPRGGAHQAEAAAGAAGAAAR